MMTADHLTSFPAKLRFYKYPASTLSLKVASTLFHCSPYSVQEQPLARLFFHGVGTSTVSFPELTA